MSVAAEYDDRIVRARRFAEAGQWRDARVLLEPIASSAGSDVPSELLLLRGETLLRLGESAAARAWLSESLGAVVRRHDRIAERALWNQLGVSNFVLGELDSAENAFLQALGTARQDRDDLIMARATNNLGAIANVRGQRDMAIAYFQLAIPAFQRLGQPRGLAETYHHLALACREMGRLNESEEYERQAIEYATLAGADRLVVMADTGLAEIGLQRGDARLAERRALQAARRFADLDDPANQADALRLAGAARVVRGRPAEARETLDLAIELARDHGVAIVEGEALWERAKCAKATADLVAARADASAALQIFERVGSAQGPLLRAWIDGLRASPPQ